MTATSFGLSFVHDEVAGKSDETVRKLSAAERDGIAHAMLQLAERNEPEAIAPECLPAVLRGLAQAERREFAGDKEIESAFRHFGR